MKRIFPVAAFILVLLSCNNAKETKTEPVEQPKFFPVTSFLKGEIYNIKKAGINPLKYTTVNNRTDSVWLKIEEIEDAVKEFLHPEIDSANLTSLFRENSFHDQSINSITFTYEPSVALPDTMKLVRWDVYIDPNTSNVKRIYMVKEISKSTTLRLTWIPNQWCQMISVVTDENGESQIEKEEKIVWDF